MQAFAALLDALVYTPGRNAKLRLIGDYLKATPDPDRGWALAAMTGGLDLKAVKASQVRAAAEARVDPVLFGLSYDFVGDLAETVALIWPEPAPPHLPNASAPGLAETVGMLAAASRAEAPGLVTGLLDRLDSAGRFALIKLATGALRVGVSARLARTALAEAFALDLDAVEEIWPALTPPYASLFAWAEGRGPQPQAAQAASFRPFMLAHPWEGEPLAFEDHAVEWKWDGIRVQAARMGGGAARLFSRGGEEVTAAFPDVAGALAHDCVLDGELLVRGATQGGEAASFSALQQRLNRKMASPKALAESPAFVRVYDLLFEGREDLRPLPWEARRARLEAFIARLDPARFDVSALVEAADWEELAAIRSRARDAAIEGLMLKRRDAPYVAGRRAGLWWKWKRDPLTADCVMMYAQRGHGKRSSFYSDYTFGCWSEDGRLLPVGKAYSGITDAELAMLDRFVRANTVARFGPVREVEKTLVLEIAFDSIHRSPRHKSGLAMRFPRIHRIRTDKPAGEADRIATLMALAGAGVGEAAGS
jgi:DNA ligase-1